MIVDTSALIAILRAEPDAEVYAVALAGDPSPRISAANYLETFVYALAKEDREPLLFKGKDFEATDVVPAVSAPPQG
ncbi:hypothetical protein BH23ACT9_BH23ACT9_32510 [soil metagenome]